MIMTNNNVLEEYFIWDEKNSTDRNQNLTMKEGIVNENSIIETKNDLTQKDWKDITDPKLRKKMRCKAYYEANKEKIKNYLKINEDKIKLKKKVYNEINREKIRLQTKSYREKNKEKIKSRTKKYRETYYQLNKEKINLKTKKYYEINKDKLNLVKKNWREKNKNKIKAYNDATKEKRKVYYLVNKDRQKVYRKINKDRIRIYKKNYSSNKFKTDIQYKLSHNLRVRLYKALNNNFKSGSAVRDLGCTIEELKKYLESKFQPGMTWDNWSIDGWHIDHVKPLSLFDLTDRKQLLEACHYTNLQPIWAKDNLSKGDNYPTDNVT